MKQTVNIYMSLYNNRVI